MNTTSTEITQIPQWIIDIHFYRKRLFLVTIEPIIITIFGPVVPPNATLTSINGYSSDCNDTTGRTRTAAGLPCGHITEHHRELGFLPDYIEDVSSFRETSMSFATLTMLFIIMSSIAMVFLSCFYHNQKTSPLFISPRRHRLPKLVPPPLPVDSFFSWVKVCFYLSDEEIINRIGYDSLILLRFHRLALRCIVKMSIFSFLVLLPINYTGGGHANASDIKGYVGSLLFTDFLRFTMANVNGGSPRLWVHCFAAYLLTGIVCRELIVEYNAFNSIRHRFLLSREPHLRTVLVSNIPRHLRSPDKISTYFRNVYPEAVKTVTMCQNLMILERLVSDRTKVLSQIERELLLLCRNEKRKLLRPSKFQAMQSVLCSCLIFEKIGMLDGAQERLAKLYGKLESLNDQVSKEKKRRKRVMKRLDKMEAGKGQTDIDYILASPFAGEYHEKAGGGSSKGMDEEMESSPEQSNVVFRSPAIGAPRNPDGTVQSSSTNRLHKVNQVSRHSDCARHENEIPPEAEIPKTQDPGTLKPISKERSHSSSLTTFHSEPSTSAASGTGPANSAAWNMDGNPDFFLDDLRRVGPEPNNSNKTEAQPQPIPFARANTAIRRYTHLARDVSFLGRPYPTTNDSHSTDQDHTHTPTTSSPFEGHNIENHTNEVCDKAFIQMRTFTASTIAIQSMHSSKPGSMQVTTAPEPRDILWQNVYVSKGAKRTRSYIGETLVLLLIGFYVVPVALVSLLVSESALVSSSPRLAQLDQASAFFSTGIAMVQPLCLVGIQQLLPPLFIAISSSEGLIAFSEAQMRAFSRYFLFQVLNVFLVTAIAGSIFDTIAIIIENPEAAFEMLGNSLPRMSSFFITYVIMKTCMGLGVELVRSMSLVQATIRYILFPNSTLRSQRSVRLGMRAIDDPGWFPFHKILAQDMLVVVISVVFSVIAPLVLLPCAVYCLFSRIMWTHHHLYVYESVFETGGQFWPKIFRRFVFGLIIAQMTITGQFILKEARHEAYATMVLMFLTYFFLRSTRARYDAQSSTLPLEVATVMDIRISQEEEMERRRQQQIIDSQNQHQNPNNPSSFESSTKQGADGSGRVRFTNGSSFRLNQFEIGRVDPFDEAFVQPALRATPNARPEQPFPPSQLGREEVFLQHTNDDSLGFGLMGGGVYDDGATVRLKSLNQQDRKLVNRWWKDQLQRCGRQDIFPILIGEKSGTLLIGRRANLVENDSRPEFC